MIRGSFFTSGYPVALWGTGKLRKLVRKGTRVNPPPPTPQPNRVKNPTLRTRTLAQLFVGVVGSVRFCMVPVVPSCMRDELLKRWNFDACIWRYLGNLLAGREWVICRWGRWEEDIRVEVGMGDWRWEKWSRLMGWLDHGRSMILANHPLTMPQQQPHRNDHWQKLGIEFQIKPQTSHKTTSNPPL